MRMVVDEHIGRAVVEALVRLGHDVVMFGDAGRLGLPDDAQLEWAWTEGRVVVTHDPDYVELISGGREHAGIAFCEFAKYRGRVGALTLAVATIVDGLTQEAAANTLMFL